MSPEYASAQHHRQANITTIHPFKCPETASIRSFPLSPTYRGYFQHSSSNRRPSPPLAGVYPVPGRRKIAGHELIDVAGRKSVLQELPASKLHEIASGSFLVRSLTHPNLLNVVTTTEERRNRLAGAVRQQNADHGQICFARRKSTLQELPMSKWRANTSGRFLERLGTHPCLSNDVTTSKEGRNRLAGVLYEKYDQHFPPLISTKLAGKSVGQKSLAGGSRTDMLSSRLDHPTKTLKCNSVTSIFEADEKTLNFDTETTSSHSELLKSLDGENICAKDVSILTATSQVYDQGMYSGGKPSEASILVDKDLHLEEIREIPKERGSHSVIEMPALRRSRSPSVDVALEPDSKRPAMLCDFFAKGWCIKGSSCRFLHQKHDVTENARRSIKNELPEKVSRAETKDNEGFREETEKQSSTSQTDKSSSSLPHVILQKALVRAYGDQKKGDKFPTTDQQRFLLSSGHYHLSDEFYSSKSLLAKASKHSSVPDDTLFSSSSSIDLKLHGSICKEKYAVETTLHRRQNKYETNMLNWTGTQPFDPTVANSFRHESSVAQTYPHKLNSYIHHGYGSQSNRLLCKDAVSDFGRQHFTRSYPTSECYHSPIHPKVSTISLDNKIQYHNKSTWEPSMRFQSSFCPPAKVSSPESQYDPLLDSIEPSNPSTQNPARMLGTHIFSRESPSLHHNTQEFSETVSQLQESNYSFGNGMKENLSVVTEPFVAENLRNNGYFSNEDKNHSSSFVDVSSAMQLDNSVRSNGDGNKQNKESKLIKFFRTALAEFVKDLLKPSWREGHLSKDAHKLIVKKAVEKVIGALQPHQIPSTTESTNQYFLNSRTKLLKLVEGYVEKYKSATR